MSTTPMQQPDDPFAGLVAQQQTPAQPGNADDPFAHIVQAVQPSSQEQPGFWSRAYEASPLPGVIDAAKGAVSDLVNTPVQGEQNFHAMVDSLKSGDFKGAAGHAAQLLVGDANPFQDAAKGVISGIVKDAHQAGRDIQTRNLSAIPVVGTAVNSYAKDVAAGNSGAAAGDVVGGATSLLPMLLGDEGTATKASDAASTATDAVKSAAGKAKALVSEDAASQVNQPQAQSAIREATSDVNKNLRATEGVAPEPSASIRDSVQDVADAVKARSKGAYQALDEASNGRWQRFDDQLSNLRDKMAETSGIDDEAYSKFEQRAQDIEAAQNDLINGLVKEGKISPDLAESATADYKQASALSDLSQQIRNSTKGRAGFDAEQVNVSSLRDRANKLYDSGRLQQALGEDGADRFMQQISEANRVGKEAISRAKLVKNVAKWAGLGVGATILGQGAAHVLGGHQ